MNLRKILCLSVCLLSLSGLPAHADFIATDFKQLKPTYTAQKPVIFVEDEKHVVAFGAITMPQNNQSLILMSDNKKSDLWHAMTNNLGPKVKWTYNIIQWQDTDTNRFFYTITSFWTMDSTENAYLIGYDKDHSQVNEFINGNKVSSNAGYGPVFTKKDGQLYFLKRGQHWGDDGEIYKLQWSEKDQWFGYEYLPEGLPRKTASEKFQPIFITCTIASAKAKAVFSSDEITLHVGQKAHIQLSADSIDPGAVKWKWRSESGEKIIQPTPGEKNPPVTTVDYEFKGMHPGWMQLKLMPNEKDPNRDGILTIHVIR